MTQPMPDDGRRVGRRSVACPHCLLPRTTDAHDTDVNTVHVCVPRATPGAEANASPDTSTTDTSTTDTAYREVAATAVWAPRVPGLSGVAPAPARTPGIAGGTSGRAEGRHRRTIRLPLWALVTMAAVIVASGLAGALSLGARLQSAAEPASAVGVPGASIEFERPPEWKVTDLRDAPEVFGDLLAGSQPIDGVVLENRATQISIMHVPNVLGVTELPSFPRVMGGITVTGQAERDHHLGPARDLVGRVDVDDASYTIQTTLVLTDDRIVVVGALFERPGNVDVQANMDAFEHVVRSLRLRDSTASG